jgi:flagella synthesis protein FlgN
MSINENVKKISSHLEQEINWIKQLNILLSEEKEVLATRQFDRLEELGDKKQDLSTKLEESAQQRMLMLGINPDKAPSLSLKDFIKDCNKEEAAQVDKLNTELAEQLTICRESNTVNGQVIANNIHTRQQIVNALSGNKADAVAVYTASGDMKSSSAHETGHHREA